MGACCTKVTPKNPIKAVSEKNTSLIQTESKFPTTNEVVKYKSKVTI
jgi:hypothetical protein